MDMHTYNKLHVKVAHEIFHSKETGPTPEAVAWFEANKGREVSIKGTGDYVGKIVRLNTRTTGIYYGGRYPIIVELIAGTCDGKSVTGYTFEYDIDSLELI